ncbi:MAG: hypothetical protein ABIH23_09075, partial [bacterium]
MKRIPSIVVLPLLFLSPVLIVKPNADPLEEYKKGRIYLSAVERFELARQAIETTDDQAVLDAAFGDLAWYTTTPERCEEMLVILDEMIAKNERGREAFGLANILKARVLARLGRKEESQALFRRAISELWHKKAYMQFMSSLWDNRDNALAAIEEFRQQTSDEFNP